MSEVSANRIVTVDHRRICKTDARANFGRVSSLDAMQALKLREMVTIRRSTESMGSKQPASVTSIPHDAGEVSTGNRSQIVGFGFAIQHRIFVLRQRISGFALSSAGNAAHACADRGACVTGTPPE
jgi:hypothetical protein